MFSGGSSRNQPIGTAFSSNIGSNTSKMGFFGKKDEPETNHSDLFYSKSFPAGRNNLTDNLVSITFNFIFCNDDLINLHQLISVYSMLSYLLALSVVCLTVH